MRLTYHPGPFTVIASDNKWTVKKAIKELNQHSEIMDMMGLRVSPYSAINIHVGTTKGGKERSIKTFIESFNKLNPNAQKRLTVENDDKPSMYSVADLMEIHYATKIPIVFDFLHHDCHPGEHSMKDSLSAALATWPFSIKPLTHYSSSRKINEDASCKVVAHADWIYEEINDFGFTFDCEIESKGAELAVQPGSGTEGAASGTSAPGSGRARIHSGLRVRIRFGSGTGIR